MKRIRIACLLLIGTILFVLPASDSCAAVPITNTAVSHTAIDEGYAPAMAATRAGLANAQNISAIPRRRYRQQKDMRAASQAFYLGLFGVGIFSWLLLSVEFFLAAEFAFWIVAVLVFLFGTEAFFGGIDILKEGMAGKGLAVMAVIFGCITIIPPAEWLLLYIESIIEGIGRRIDRGIDKLLFPHYTNYYHTEHRTHIRRPYYRWFRARFA